MCARVGINNARRMGARAEWDRRASATEGWRANAAFVVSSSARLSKRAVGSANREGSVGVRGVHGKKSSVDRSNRCAMIPIASNTP